MRLIFNLELVWRKAYLNALPFANGAARVGSRSENDQKSVWLN